MNEPENEMGGAQRGQIIPDEAGSNESGKAQVPVSREQLYEEVWAEPMLKVAARYEVSSSYMARVCTRLNVPRPPVGYWSKVAVGKAPKRPLLPETQGGGELTWTPGGTADLVAPPLPKKRETPITPRRKRMKSLAHRAGSHPLLGGAEALFLMGGQTESGYLKPSKKLLLDLVVSKAGLSRGLQIANQLYQALESRGHRVVMAPRDQQWPRHAVDERESPTKNNRWVNLWSPMRPTLAFIDTLGVGLTIFELSEQVEVERVGNQYVRKSELPAAKRQRRIFSDWVRKEDMPSGRFCIQAYASYYHGEWVKQWREKTAGDIEARVHAIVKELEKEVPAIIELVEEGRRQAEIARQRWEEQREQWRREEEARRRAAALKASQEDLNAIISAWGEAMQMEAFFRDAESKAAGLCDEERQALVDRLKRARELVGGVEALERFRAWKAPEER